MNILLQHKHQSSLLVLFSLVTQLPFVEFASAGIAPHPEITSYYMTGPDVVTDGPEFYATLENLENLEKRIRAKGAVNFNKIVISFVQPSLEFYDDTKESLACTGLFGTFCDRSSHEGALRNKALHKCMNDVGSSKFQKLKSLVPKFQEMGVEVFIALGGWDFSCHPKYYGKTSSMADACGPKDAYYDTFPNPLDKKSRFDHEYDVDTAKDSYRKVVSLAKQLGVNGIDLDYQEVWHADMNAYEWEFTPESFEKPGESDNAYKTYTTEELMTAGRGEYLYTDEGDLQCGDCGKTRIMPETVDKFAAILQELRAQIRAQKPTLKLSVAAPAVGAIPNMAANWGTDARTVDPFGGAWWGGNLYGLVYNTALRSPKDIDSLSAIGLMSYDLSENDCGLGKQWEEATEQKRLKRGGNIVCKLAGQDKFYYGTYINFLKSGSYALLEGGLEGSPSHVGSTGSSSTYDAITGYGIRPKKLMVAPPIHIGFEVGQPAAGQLILTKDAVDEVLSYTGRTQSGIILWDLFKDIRVDGGNWEDDWARPRDVLQKACTQLGLGGSSSKYNYDCSVDVLNVEEEVPETVDVDISVIAGAPSSTSLAAGGEVKKGASSKVSKPAAGVKPAKTGNNKAGQPPVKKTATTPAASVGGSRLELSAGGGAGTTTPAATSTPSAVNVEQPAEGTPTAVVDDEDEFEQEPVEMSGRRN